jgi:hypothetical protein
MGEFIKGGISFPLTVTMKGHLGIIWKWFFFLLGNFIGPVRLS